MALITYNKITDIGVPATYWVISSITLGMGALDYYENEAHKIVLDGYLSEATYNQPGSRYIKRLEFIIKRDDEHASLFSEDNLKISAQNGKSIYDVAYEYIQLVDEELIDMANHPCHKCLLLDCQGCEFYKGDEVVNDK